MMNKGGVNIKIDNGIAEMEFFHPKSNSLPGKLLKEMSEKIDELAGGENVKVIILKSAGERSFCAGASFDELIELNDLESAKKFFMGFANLIFSMKNCPKFIIVRVQGKTIGGGVGLISAGDYAIAAKNASVRLSELSLGIGPSVIGPAVVRKIGKSAFTAMTIDQEWHSAEWAREKGLYSSVVNSIVELNIAVNELAEKLSKNSPEAMSKLKKMFWEDAQNWESLLEKRAEMSGRLVLSDFTKSYIQKFKAKK